MTGMISPLAQSHALLDIDTSGAGGQPKAWWQRVIAGEPLPKGPLVAKSKCEGTVEDHRNIALDVRELIRKHVFENGNRSAIYTVCRTHVRTRANQK
jgi:hypothetical protein